MRYREGVELAPDTADGTHTRLTDDFVALTVWMTFFIGVLFTVIGFKARQRWMLFWGTLTLVACGWYWTYFLAL